MLRPPCIDVGAGAIIHDGKFLAARRAQVKNTQVGGNSLAASLRKAK